MWELCLQNVPADFSNCVDKQKASPRVVFFGVTARNCITVANQEPEANPSQGSYPWLESELDSSVATPIIILLKKRRIDCKCITGGQMRERERFLSKPRCNSYN